jgi:Protein of unknown function (DUF3606)
MTIDIHPLKSDRSHIELSSDALVRHWTKTLGKTKAEIEAVILKVGDNPETVAKELGLKL